VLTDNEIVTVTETEKTVTITDDDGNSVTSIVIETKETVKKVSLSVSAYAGAGINYCKANKISYKTLTDTTT
ncbi:MAG: hypothetical protein J5850_04390, partial [Clostridia bacterium]|nr:hypothetical protein [Clostridia bacterium]